jgi:hypothetical protein
MTTVFNWIRILGLFSVSGIGIFRLYYNYLETHERWVYILAVFTSIWFGIGYTLGIFYEPLGLEKSFQHGFLRFGWPFLIVTLILFMLYYRRFPLKSR